MILALTNEHPHYSPTHRETEAEKYVSVSPMVLNLIASFHLTSMKMELMDPFLPHN
jgi:hypothetical protein